MHISLNARYRWVVLSRIAAAIGGGYALSTVATIAIACWLPVHKYDAMLSGLMMGYVVYPCAVMYAFAARTALKAWAGLLILTAALSAVAALGRLASLHV